MPLACSRIGLRSSASMNSWVSRCSKASVLLTARLVGAAACELGRSTMTRLLCLSRGPSLPVLLDTE
jgi:hypothetical protein